MEETKQLQVTESTENTEALKEEKKSTRFEDMLLDSRILRAIREMGFEEASPIQAGSIPVLLEGKDLIGQAQTGTGKTASYGIPLLQRIDTDNRKLQALVLCPTRELAIQVSDEMRRLAKFMHGIKILPIYGGQEINKQIRSLKGGVSIVIGTPGRVMDHMRRKTLRMEDVSMVVLDEADEMLNMGFREDMETILSETPESRQTILLSATMPRPIVEIAKTYQKDAVTVKVVKKELTVPKIEQYYYEVRERNKMDAVCRLLDCYDPKRSLIFCNTKKQVDMLTQELKNRGYFADGIHGDCKQFQRDRVMNGFRNGRTEILVATDVAARGIDVDDVEAVINYDVPQDDEYYVHRIGRTGRAGRSGKAFTLVVGKEVYKLRDIMRYCRTKIKCMALPSNRDIIANKAEKTLSEIAGLIENTDLSRYISILDDAINANEYTAMDVAAAFLAKEMEVHENQQEIESTPFKEEPKVKRDEPRRRRNYNENSKRPARVDRQGNPQSRPSKRYSMKRKED